MAGFEYVRAILTSPISTRFGLDLEIVNIHSLLGLRTLTLIEAEVKLF